MSDDRWTVDLEPAFVETSDRSVHVWTAGHGPPAVLLHGFSDDGLCWVGTAGIFTRRGYRVIAPDARAHGRTPLLSDDGFTAAERVGDVVALIESLDLGKALVVGHSMGALTGMLLAADHPHLVERLVLIDPPLARADDPSLDSENVFDAWIERLQALSRDELTLECGEENPSWTIAEVEAWVSSKLLVDRELFSRRKSWLGRPWREVLARTEMPVIVLAGQTHLGSTVDRQAGDWLDTATHPEFARLHGAGHSVHRDRRVPFADLVCDFLDGRSPQV